MTVKKDSVMSVDQQEQQDEICPSCKKAIRKRSKGSFTAWIFQDSICRCVPGSSSIEDAVVAASADVPVQSTANARKRSLLGESAPVVVPHPQHSLQHPPQSLAHDEFPLNPAQAPPLPSPIPSLPSSQHHSSSDSMAPQAVQEAPSSGLITCRDLVATSVASVLVYGALKLSGNNDTVAFALVGSIVVVTLIALGIRFVRK